jgi:hypothetical protein
MWMLALFACTKDGSDTDSSPTDTEDTSVTDDTGEIPAEAGDDFALYDDDTLSLFLNDSFVIPDTANREQVLGEDVDWMALADFDGDGRDDFWQLPDEGGKVRIYMNDGTGTFSTVDDFRPDTTAGARRPVVAGDFDGDGRDDVVLFVPANGRAVVFPNRTGGFSEDDKVASDSALGDVGTYSSADVDGDGIDEIIQLANRDVRVWDWVDDTMVLDESEMLFTGTIDAPQALFGMDLNDDGYDELAAWTGSKLVVYENTRGVLDLSSATEFTFSGVRGVPLAGQVR